MNLTILGCGSAMPSARHRPSCQALEVRGRIYMIDCGEGAQEGWRACGLHYRGLRHVFISHLHGDHVLGLPGLLATMAMNAVKGSVTVHVFEKAIPVLKRMTDMFIPSPPFELLYEPVAEAGGEMVLDDDRVMVSTVPLHHRVPCVGYIFREKASGASYGYCSDTFYKEDLAEGFRGVDLLYHDATYAGDRRAQAARYGHSTAAEAARTALDAGAASLLLGHFSKAYRDEERHLREARAVFPASMLATEGLRLTIGAKD